MAQSSREFDEKTLKSTVVIVDIEGTTTSISFVKDKLFPYATEKVTSFLTSKWEEEAVQQAVEGMRAQAIKDVEDKVADAVPIPAKDADKELQITAVSDNLKWLISIDNKGTFMKQLSGLIWEEGYKAGDLKGHVYPDVPVAMEAWRAAGRRLFVYSSGSEHAQRLLMNHSEAGDLQHLFEGNFDTQVGLKREAQSYKNIIEKIGCNADEALFLTDIVQEGEAAHEAGLNAVLLVRPGNAALSEADLQAFCTVSSFADLPLVSATKRKPDDKEEELPPAKIAKTTQEDTLKPTNGDQNTSLNAAEENGTSPQVSEGKPDNEEAMEVDVADAPKPECEDSVPEVPIQEEVKEQIETEMPKLEDSTNKTEGEEKSEEVEVPQSMETDNAETGEVENKEPVALPEEATPTVEEKTTAEEVKEPEIVIPEKTDKELKCKIKETEPIEKKEVKQIENQAVEGDIAVADEPESDFQTVQIKEVEEAETEETKVQESKVEEAKTEADIIALNTDPAVGNVAANPVADEEMEDKINELLGEEGVALEKECNEILNKVNEVTNMCITPKAFIQNAKETEEKMDVTDDTPATAQEEPAKENGNVEKLTEKIIADDSPKIDNTGSSAVDSKETELKTSPVTESIPAELSNVTPQDENPPVGDVPETDAKEVTQSSLSNSTNVLVEAENKPVQVEPTSEENKSESTDNIEVEASVKSNGDSAKEINGDNVDLDERINGKSDASDLNGKESSTKAQNGGTPAEEKDSKSTPEEKDNTPAVEDRLKGANGTPAEPDKSETVSETTEIKVKKISTEEVATEIVKEQSAET